MKAADLRERLAAASLLLSDPALSAEAEAELFQYMARIIRARRSATTRESESPKVPRVSALDTRSIAVMQEWERSPVASYADLRERFKLSSGTASRVVTRLAESGVLVKAGRWWKLVNKGVSDIRPHGESSAVHPVKNLDDRAARLLYEWQLSPLANLVDITNRLGVSRSAAQRLTYKLAEAGFIVKAGRWWKLMESGIGDAASGAGVSA